MLLPSTRAQAIAAGSSKYHTGKPCVNGHIEDRYTRTGDCSGCVRDRNAINRQVVKEAMARGAQQ